MLGSQALFFTVYHTAVIRLFLIGMNEVDDITLEWGIVLVLLMNRSVYFLFFFCNLGPSAHWSMAHVALCVAILKLKISLQHHVYDIKLKGEVTCNIIMHNFFAALLKFLVK